MEKRLREFAQSAKPARYTGGEYNQIIRIKKASNIRVPSAPGTYE